MSSSEILRLKFRLARQGLTLTQSEVAKRIGVSLRTLQRIESGHTPLDVGTLYLFCENLNVDFLKLTTPELKPDQVETCTFFKSEADFLNQPQVNDSDVIKVKNDLMKWAQEKPAELLSKNKDLKVLNEVETPLLLTDAHTSVANPCLNKSSHHYREAKWKTASKFEEPMNFIQAFDISLNHGFSGFKITNSINEDIGHEKYYLFLNPNPANPIAIAQVV